jgi:hypothetical protein
LPATILPTELASRRLDMVDCAYCEKPLICASCQAPYVPPNQEAYEALSHPEEPLVCPQCEAVLVCHWCKTPFDGRDEENDEAAD